MENNAPINESVKEQESIFIRNLVAYQQDRQQLLDILTRISDLIDSHEEKERSVFRILDRILRPPSRPAIMPDAENMPEM